MLKGRLSGIAEGIMQTGMSRGERTLNFHRPNSKYRGPTEHNQIVHLNGEKGSKGKARAPTARSKFPHTKGVLNQEVEG